ncbi:MAG: YncE family protein [Pseudomonadota bacterium]|jgi:DNA-binding beta-propeller fold protein YncE
MIKTRISLAAMAIALAMPAGLSAQIAVSANDGKQLRPGDAGRTADSVSVIDLRSYPPKTIGTVAAPASMIGAPAAVAVARNGGFALVSAAQRLKTDGTLELNDQVSVIDLIKPTAPAVAQTVQAGPGASGVTINRAGTLALVASTGDDTVSIFTIRGKRLTPAGKVQLAAKARPTDVVFLPNGKGALAVAQSAGQLVRLSVSGDSVKIAGEPISTGVQPYGVTVSPDSRYAYNTNLQGNAAPAGTPTPRGPRVGTVTATDLATGHVGSVEVGFTPEHLTLSRDGRYLAVVVHNGSGGAPGSPGYWPNGALKIYGVNGTKLTPITEAKTGAWCQGATFSDDARTLLLQCALHKNIEVYRFNGKALIRDEAATLQFDARPGAIATANSR